MLARVYCGKQTQGSCLPHRRGLPVIQARGSRQTRLTTTLVTVPRRVDLYFAGGGMNCARSSALCHGCPQPVNLNTQGKTQVHLLAGSLVRKTIWSAISFFAGFYAANTVSLSFGALAINDVVAAAVTVAFCELTSRAYYSAPRLTLKLVFANAFKIGVTSALIADALKLGT